MARRLSLAIFSAGIGLILTAEHPRGALTATLPWTFTLGAAGMVLLAERTLHLAYKEYGLPPGNHPTTNEPQSARSS